MTEQGVAEALDLRPYADRTAVITVHSFETVDRDGGTRPVARADIVILGEPPFARDAALITDPFAVDQLRQAKSAEPTVVRIVARPAGVRLAEPTPEGIAAAERHLAG